MTSINHIDTLEQIYFTWSDFTAEAWCAGAEISRERMAYETEAEWNEALGECDRDMAIGETLMALYGGRLARAQRRDEAVRNALALIEEAS